MIHLEIELRKYGLPNGILMIKMNGILQKLFFLENIMIMVFVLE